jgi:uncharacterized protein YggE
MRKLIFFLASCIFSNLHAEIVNEATAEFMGKGRIRVKADYLSLTLDIGSECQPSPRDAQEATDEVVTKINNYLEKLKEPDDKYFKILINGGFTASYSRFNRDRELCKNTFQKHTNIIFKTALRKDFDKVFSRIQGFVLNQFNQGPFFTGSEMAQTYVTVSIPNPEITHEHRRSLERKALDLALRDAKANFMAAIKSCGPQQWKIISIKEIEAIKPQPILARSALAMEGQNFSSENVAPIKFDLIEIIKSLRVTFHFEGAMCFAKQDN